LCARILLWRLPDIIAMYVNRTLHLKRLSHEMDVAFDYM
jgi:hypothetical protein